MVESLIGRVDVSDKHYYTDEKNAQIVIALLKAHGIRKVIANPGTTNIAFVGSVQNDPWFQVYSGVDERHSAYLACGMAAESGEAVVLSCTGATASRNYLSALTEAYYRKLPILALTSIHHLNSVGNLLPQMLDRTLSLRDAVRFSLQCPVPHTTEDEQDCVSNVNKAILELFRHGGGPVHINLETARVPTFNTQVLPKCRVIQRISTSSDKWPIIDTSKKIIVWIGAHKHFTSAESCALTKFIETHNAVILVDHTSGYFGEGVVHPALVCSQMGRGERFPELVPDLVVQIGEISGDYPTFSIISETKALWRVSEDGEVRDSFKKLTNVFEMSEDQFFRHYNSDKSCDNSYLKDWLIADKSVRLMFPELPFSNFWMAQQLHTRIPSGSVIHFGILNSLRSWNLCEMPLGVLSNSNVGGFGIDGCMSSLLGASLVNPDKLYFLVIGDLAFFYDLNSLGNRHIGKNVRILLVNNGCGCEFNRYRHPGSQFGEQTNDYIAAGRHNGNCSRELVRHYVQDLGFKYLSAEDKDEFVSAIDAFVSPQMDKSVVFECFTTAKNESDAAYLVDHIIDVTAKTWVKQHIKSVVSGKVKNVIKELIK